MAAPAPRVEPLDVDPGRESPVSLAVVSDADAATALLTPTRRDVLAQLRHEGSATTVATSLGLSRQLANYHVRALERAGLVEEVGRRRRRGLEERMVRATATRYLIAPQAHDADAGADTAPVDRFSAAYQVATAARTIREVAALADGARKAGKRLTTLTLDTELTFASPADREAFANELVGLVTDLVARYHKPRAANGRRYRLFAGAHPTWLPPADASSRSAR